MTYTINDISPEIEESLRARALTEQKSLERVIQDALRAYVVANSSLQTTPSKAKRDLSDVAGRCTIDDATRAAFESQRQIDPKAEAADYPSPSSEHADSAFSGVIGTWQEDPQTEAILKEQRQVDPETEPASYRDLSGIVNGPPLDLEVAQAIEDLRSIDGEDWG